MNMDFDFTDDEGNGLEIDAHDGTEIVISASYADDYAPVFVTPTDARAIAEALNAAADHMEETR